jgi:hypothetical protein
MIAKGIESLRATAFEDGAATGRAGGRVPRAPDLRPFAASWRAGYALGRRERAAHERARKCLERQAAESDDETSSVARCA